jgi:hypothetical protein
VTHAPAVAGSVAPGSGGVSAAFERNDETLPAALHDAVSQR